MSSSAIIFTAHQGMPRCTPLAIFGMLVSLTLSLLNVESEHWLDGVYALSLKSISKNSTSGPSFKNLKDGLKLAVGQNTLNLYGIQPQYKRIETKDDVEPFFAYLWRDLTEEGGHSMLTRGSGLEPYVYEGVVQQKFIFDLTMPAYKEIMNILIRKGRKGGLLQRHLPIENKINLLVSLLIVNFTKNIANKDAQANLFYYKKALEARLKELIKEMPKNSSSTMISNKVNEFFEGEKKSKSILISKALPFHQEFSECSEIIIDAPEYTFGPSDSYSLAAAEALEVLNLDGSLANVTRIGLLGCQ